MSEPRMPTAMLARVPPRTRAAAWLRRWSRSGARRRVGLAAAVGLGQSAALYVVHARLPPSWGGFAAVAILLALLAGFWIGTVEFVRMIRGKLNWPSALLTTAAFYALALTIDSAHALQTACALLPVALLAALGLPRGAWSEAPRPELPKPSSSMLPDS